MNTLDPLGLVWNQHKENLGKTFQELRQEKDFLDVTLACNDEDILGHKVVLAASSPFLRRIFQRHPESHHPLVYLNGVDARLVSALVDFMYRGEVEVERQHLPAFLNLAKNLQVRGLCGETRESGVGQEKEEGRSKEGVKEEMVVDGNLASEKVDQLSGDLAKGIEVVVDTVEQQMEEESARKGADGDKVIQKLNKEDSKNETEEDSILDKEEDGVNQKEEDGVIHAMKEGEEQHTNKETSVELDKKVVWSKDKQLNDWIVNNVVRKAQNGNTKEAGEEEMVEVDKIGKAISEEQDAGDSSSEQNMNVEHFSNLSREDHIYLRNTVASGKKLDNENDSGKKSDNEICSVKKSKLEKADERGDELPAGWRRLVHKREGGKKLGR